MEKIEDEVLRKHEHILIGDEKRTWIEGDAKMRGSKNL